MVDIHQIRLISLFRHFSDHFHFPPILEQKRVIDLIPCHNDDDNADVRDPVFEPSVESCDQIMCYGRFQRHSLLLYVGGWRTKKG